MSIGSGLEPFVFVRRHKSIFRVEFVKKWTRERNRRPKRSRKETCVLQPSTANPRTGNLSIATVDPESHRCCTCLAYDVTFVKLLNFFNRAPIGTRPDIRKRSFSSVHTSLLLCLYKLIHRPQIITEKIPLRCRSRRCWNLSRPKP